MNSIGDDFLIPSMYRDLGSMSVDYMASPFGMPYGGYYSALGGVRLRPQADEDKFISMETKDRHDRNNAKKVLMILGGLIALTFVGPLYKSVKNAGGISKFVDKQWQILKGKYTTKKSAKGHKFFGNMFDRLKKIFSFKKKPVK